MPITEVVNNVTNDNYILLPENNEDYITINASDARVGINVNDPQYTLDISNGTVNISNGYVNLHDSARIIIEGIETEPPSSNIDYTIMYPYKGDFNSTRIKIINGIIVDISNNE